MTIDDGQTGIELGNIYSGGEHGSGNRNNPMHGVEIPSPSTVPVKRPSGVPYPPLDWDGYDKEEFREAKKQSINYYDEKGGKKARGKG